MALRWWNALPRRSSVGLRNFGDGCFAEWAHAVGGERACELCPVGDVELSIRALQVGLDRAWAQVEERRDLAVAQAGGSVAGHAQLLRRELVCAARLRRPLEPRRSCELATYAVGPAGR